MLISRHIPTALLLFALSHTAFTFKHYITQHRNQIGQRAGIALRSILREDEPFVFTQCAEPGKENEVIISQRESRGINKVIRDVERRNNRNDPIYPVGSLVFVKRGKFRCSRGTVLFNKPTQIAKPYEVLVALDCRNAEGLLKEDFSMDHGTGMWFSENDLSDQEIYTQKTPPRLNVEKIPVTKYSYIRTPKIYISDIINSTRYEEIVALYRDAVDTRKDNIKTAITAYKQIARALNELYLDHKNRNRRGLKEKFESFKNLIAEKVDPTLIEEMADRITEYLGTDNLTPIDYSWILWATAKYNYFDICSKKFLRLVNLINERMTYRDLKSLDQTCLCNIILCFTRFRLYSYENVYNMAKILTSVHPDQVKTLAISLLARVFYIRSLDPGSFLDHLNNYVLKYHHKISKSEAIYLLISLENFKIRKEQVLDKLYSIIFAHEGPRDKISDSSYFYNLLVSSIRDKEMFTLFERDVYASDTKVEPFALIRSLQVLSKTNYNKMKIWLLDNAISNITTFSDLDLKKLLSTCYRVENVPKELLRTLYKHFKATLFGKITMYDVPYILYFLLKHSLETPSEINGIFDRISPDFECSINTIYKTFLYMETISKKHEIDFYAQYPRILDCLVSQIKTNVRYNVPTICLMTYSICEVARDLFERASQVALHYATDEKVNPEVDRATLTLAQIIYSVHHRLSQDFSDYSPFEIIRFSAPVSQGTPKATMFYKYFDKDRICQWSIMFLYISVKSGLTNLGNFPGIRLMEFLRPVTKFLTNLDLSILKKTLDHLGVRDPQWEDLIRSVPKGIDVICKIGHPPDSRED